MLEIKLISRERPWNAGCSRNTPDPMSFVLPGTRRELRFTGEAQSLPKENVTGKPTALGRPRVRKQPTQPPAAPASENAARARLGSVKTPVPARPIETPAQDRPAQDRPAQGRRARRTDALALHGEAEADDGAPTLAMVRDDLDVLPGGSRLRKPKSGPLPNAPPIPHFRAAAASRDRETVIVTNTPSHALGRSAARAPLVLWLLVALFVGITSYHVTPQLAAKLGTPAASPPSH